MGGFTLVELLVVITVIGVLIALLMPAVQGAREAARRTECKNHLKQISLAAIQHEQAQGFYPSGGWASRWVGDPLRGFNRRQPGGWAYNILPYCEQEALWRLPDDGNALRITGQQKDNADRMLQTPLEMLYCPSRRAPVLYPVPDFDFFRPLDANGPALGARSDYGGNAGDVIYYVGDPGWISGLAQMAGVAGSFAWADTFRWPTNAGYSGVIYYRSEVQVADVIDGTSNTYLIGEKFVDTDDYTTGQAAGDNQYAFTGFNVSINRFADGATSPCQDRSGTDLLTYFGSAHATTLNMAFCDGSVQSISYSIDPETHRRLGNRKDGMPIDPKGL